MAAKPFIVIVDGQVVFEAKSLGVANAFRKGCGRGKLAEVLASPAPYRESRNSKTPGKHGRNRSSKSGE